MRVLYAITLLLASMTVRASPGLDLIVASEETKTLEKGMYEFRSVHIAERGKLILNGGVIIATEKLSSGEGATLQYRNAAAHQENISLSTFDASALKFLFIDASNESGADATGMAATGPGGRNAYKTGHSLKYPNGRSSHGGGRGGTGAAGQDGKHAANVSLHLPNLRVGSLIRIHAVGGSGGKGQQGGRGGKGGEGAFGHPASNGGPGGPGGRGGAAGNAGKISVYLVVADDASESERDSTLKTLRLEYANSAGTPGEGGSGGPGGPGGSGAFGGGDGTRGSGGGLGAGGGQGSIGMGPASHPDERWVVTSVLTQSQYAKQYTETLQKIREAMRGTE
jgi:hypothetical protein